MKRALLALSAALALSACAEDLGYGPYWGGSTVYYDDYYGPFYNGYWGPSGVFIYSDAQHRFHRDEGHHFRRDNPGGYHGVQTHPGWVRHRGPGEGQQGQPGQSGQHQPRSHDGTRGHR